MDGYLIIQQLLPVGVNRPGTPLVAGGVAIHETATPGATAKNEARYFSTGFRHASAHYFVDYETIIQIIPENEVAWHAGRTANLRYISVELCHFDDPARFLAIWERGVWLTADICRRHGLSADDVVSHAWISAKWHETGHTDPTDYFRAHGKTYADFTADVAAALLEAPTSLVERQVLYTKAIINGENAPAVVIDGKSFIGARDLAGLLGYAVAWDEATKQVILTKL